MHLTVSGSVLLSTCLYVCLFVFFSSFLFVSGSVLLFLSVLALFPFPFNYLLPPLFLVSCLSLFLCLFCCPVWLCFAGRLFVCLSLGLSSYPPVSLSLAPFCCPLVYLSLNLYCCPIICLLLCFADRLSICLSLWMMV